MAQSFMKNLCKKQRSSQAVTTEILYLVVNTIYLYVHVTCTTEFYGE